LLENKLIKINELDIFSTTEYEELFDLDVSNKMGILEGCVECYHQAMALCSTKNREVYEPLVKRHGNAHNELGVCLMQGTQHKLEISGKLYGCH